eukprot:gb/GECG01004620.1/.p1 GENE.gb/GECG01004620.1/~~gb/GECG01004620.1/.p1  ORF type:complete len:494 (+),score=98.00 gb/GECG01004620.1/:1-1482(+)
MAAAANDTCEISEGFQDRGEGRSEILPTEEPGGHEDDNDEDVGDEESDIRQQEIKNLKSSIPEHCMGTCTINLITVNLAATPYRKLTLRLIFPNAFPETAVLAEVSSETLPQMAIDKLNSVAAKTAKQTKPGNQCAAIATTLRSIVLTNKLLYCITEVKEIKNIDKDKVEVKTDEERGTLKVRLKQDDYFLVLNIAIPEEYPEVAPQFEVPKSNFPDRITKSYTLQLENILKRCEAGYSAEVALSKGSLHQAPAKVKTKAEDVVHVTSEHMRDLKKDVKFLYETTQLKKFATEKKQSSGGEYAHGAKERKHVRRQLKKLTKEEEAAEEARLKRIEEELVAEARALAVRPTNTATRSLALSVRFLADDFVFYLPKAICKISDQQLLPEDPKKAKKYADDLNHSKHPVRMACGHWFLLKPMDEHIRSPPFIHYCPHCAERLCHSRWETNVKRLEKAWTKEQEKHREVNEVSSFLELSEEFAQKQTEDTPSQFTED